MHVEIAYLRWRGKRSRHARRMLTHNFAYLARGPWASYLDSELVSHWPPHHVVPEKQSCHVLCGAWQGPGHTQIFLPKTPVAQESIFSSDVALEFEGSTQHYQFTPLPWWMTPPTETKGQRLPSVNASINLSLACGAHEHDHHWETTWRETHNWRHNVTSVHKFPPYVRSSRAVVRLLRPPRLRWCGRQVSQLRRKILLTHPCNKPNILANSHWK